jgi:predicted small secreted protein
MKTIVIVVLLAVIQTSCNTFIGVGRDLRQLGTGMENFGQGRR